jgi:hypothetical protein
VTFSADIRTEIECKNILEEIANKLSLKLRCDYTKSCLVAEYETKNDILVSNPTQKTLDDLSLYINSLNSIEHWMIKAAVDGHKNGGYRQSWETLISKIEDTAAYAESIATTMLGKKVSFKDNVVISQIKSQIVKLSEIFRKKGKITKFDTLLNKSLKATLPLVLINGDEIASLDDCNITLRYIELLEKRSETALLWDALMSNQGSPKFDELGDEPEEICKLRIPNILRYLD